MAQATGRSDVPKHVRKRPAPPPPPPSVDDTPDEILVRVKPEPIGPGYYAGCIRQPGETFMMDTKFMRRWPLTCQDCGKEGCENVLHIRERRVPDYRGEETIIKTERGDFELPFWVEYVDPDDPSAAVHRPEGHPGVFRRDSPLL